MFQLVFSVVVYGDRRKGERDYAINPNERRLIERERRTSAGDFCRQLPNEETTLLSLLFNFCKV